MTDWLTYHIYHIIYHIISNHLVFSLDVGFGALLTGMWEYRVCLLKLTILLNMYTFIFLQESKQPNGCFSLQWTQYLSALPQLSLSIKTQRSSQRRGAAHPGRPRSCWRRVGCRWIHKKSLSLWAFGLKWQIFFIFWFSPSDTSWYPIELSFNTNFWPTNIHVF